MGKTGRHVEEDVINEADSHRHELELNRRPFSMNLFWNRIRRCEGNTEGEDRWKRSRLAQDAKEEIDDADV